MNEPVAQVCKPIILQNKHDDTDDFRLTHLQLETRFGDICTNEYREGFRVLMGFRKPSRPENILVQKVLPHLS